MGCKIPRIKSEEIDKKLAPVLRLIEDVGIKVDVKSLKRLSEKLKVKSEKLRKEIQKNAGEEFNVASPTQLAKILFTKMKLPTGELKRTKSGFSTGASELEKLRGGNPIIGKILEYRELSKLVSTYLEPLPKIVDENFRLHTHFGTDTRTGRLTSANPNLQNIPIKGDFGPEIRRAFIAEKNCKLISADYSQIELRVVACLSGDKAMVEAFSSGVDIHSRTASELFRVPIEKITNDQRRLAKTVNFGVIYGISPYGLSQTLGIARESAAEYIFRYFAVHGGIKKYCEEQITQAKKLGYVETLFGFQRKLPEINSADRIKSESAQRMAINTPVQGTAAEILKLALIRLADQMQVLNQKSKIKSQNGGVKIILTVHDEVIVEAPVKDAESVAKIMKETMENVVKLSVPTEVEVGIGDNWDETKKV